MEWKQFWLSEIKKLFASLFPVSLKATEDALNDSLDILEATLDVEFNRDFINEYALEFAQNYTLDLVKGITDTTIKMFQKEASEWIESGEPLYKLFDRLSPMFGEVRARLIGVTEITRIYALGNRKAWTESGMVDFYIVQTAEDDLVCPICTPKEGEKVRLDSADEFFPPFHPLCRCYGIPGLAKWVVHRIYKLKLSA